MKGPVAFDPRQSVVIARDSELEIPGDALTFDRIEALFQRGRAAADFPLWTPELTQDRRRPDDSASVTPVPAAVLVALEGADTPSVVLTQRTGDLSTHAGQISFPGGRSEPEDASEEVTALREAHEEIGLDPLSVTLLGHLPHYLTVTGFRVRPVVARISPNHPGFVPDRSEVEEIFSVPLAFLMNPANHQWRVVPQSEQLLGRRVAFYAIPYRSPAHDGREFFIWGATAAMLRNLYRFLHAAWLQSRGPL